MGIEQSVNAQTKRHPKRRVVFNWMTRVSIRDSPKPKPWNECENVELINDLLGSTVASERLALTSVFIQSVACCDADRVGEHEVCIGDPNVPPW